MSRYSASNWRGILGALLAVTLVAGEEQAYERAKRERILGVGVGVFLLAFFFVAMCALCWAGALLPQERHEQWIFNLVGTLGFLVVACVLFFADEQPQYVSREDVVIGYDDTFIGLIIVALFLLSAAGFALATIICYHVCQPVEVPRLRRSLTGDRTGLFDLHGRCVEMQTAII
eukprot:CAMPEP_0119279372 /NCGR_PEP_ID=MMETSP1329-20130426/20691_1 /TAXON_ID=114041 /ORGANISM="Genus nov. species nov., Strain RCC1024" /LENGTH=173 /DNA_ID=CAMNT_0007279911 /DNA_START=23 /DNA_END=544 /DNA_ORIENTATION=+